MRVAIVENGIVTNMIMTGGGYTKPYVPVGELPVQIGDTYDGTDFYHDGVKVEVPNPLADEYAEALNLLGVETEETNESNNA